MSPSRGLIRGDSGGSGFDGAHLYHGIVAVRDRLPPLTEVAADFDAAVGAEAPVYDLRRQKIDSICRQYGSRDMPGATRCTNVTDRLP